MAKKYKTIWKGSDDVWHATERDSMDESVYGYITRANYDLHFDTANKLKQFRIKFPYTFAPNWEFTKQSVQYVGIEELTSLSKDQIVFAGQKDITIVGSASQFQTWLNNTGKK